MAHIEKPDQHREDEKVEELQLGSILAAVGWTFLGMGLILSVYIPSDLRQGTTLMIWMSSIFLVTGLISVGIGEYHRSEPI